MPGITILTDCASVPRIHPADSVVCDIADLTAHYQVDHLLAGDHTHIRSDAYPQYPIQTFEMDDNLICVEGRIFNNDGLTTEQALAQLTSALDSSDPNPVTIIADWIESHDGDFLIAIHNRTRETTILFNDPLARLPVYWWHDGKRALFSREIRLAVQNLSSITFDKYGLTQFLIYGYPIGQRTLFEGVNFFQPGSLATIDPSANSVTIDEYHNFDYAELEDKKHAKLDYYMQAAQSFAGVCKRHGSLTSKNALSLSGGLDSRLVGAGLLNQRIPFDCYTFIDQNGNAARDAETSESVAQAWDRKWQLIELSASNSADEMSLVSLKMGHNYVAMAFILPFLRKLRDMSDNAIYFTGSGGNQILHNLVPYRSLRSFDDLVNVMEKQYQVIATNTASDLTGISTPNFLNSIETTVDSYKQQSYKHKLLEFLIRERHIRWGGEGDDRNRYFMESMTPLLSFQFFKMAMSVPQHVKDHFQFSSAILNLLHGESAEINLAGYRHSMNSSYYRAKKMFSPLVPMLSNLKGLLRPGTNMPMAAASSAELNELKALLQETPSIGDVLNTPVLKQITDGTIPITRFAFFQLKTIMLVIKSI